MKKGEKRDLKIIQSSDLTLVFFSLSSWTSVLKILHESPTGKTKLIYFRNGGGEKKQWVYKEEGS